MELLDFTPNGFHQENNTMSGASFDKTVSYVIQELSISTASLVGTATLFDRLFLAPKIYLLFKLV